MILGISEIKEITARMSETIGVDYNGYKMSFLRRRLPKVFEELHLTKIADFYALLADRKGADEIAYRMIVPDTELFRDPSVWRQLRKRLEAKQQLKVWFPMLSNGYELYSLMVILRQLGGREIKIVVNSESQKAIDNVHNVHIPAKSKEVNESNFERLEATDDKVENYIELTDDGARMKSELLQGVEFHHNWFLSEPAATYDLIIARNRLLYYDYQLHERAVARFGESMVEGSILCIGTKEQLLHKLPNVQADKNVEGLYIKG